MKIEYLGHSCFVLTSGTGVSVVCDPYDDSVGYKMPRVKADAVTVSHHHFDHDCVSNVGGSPEIIDRECSRTLSGVEIDTVRSFHDGMRGKLRGENLIFKFRIDGINVCHLGDLGEAYSRTLVERIKPVDVLLIPVGGTYTIDASTAKEYVNGIMPDIVVPMHYKTADCKLDIGGVDGFTELFGDDSVEVYDSGCLELSRTDGNGKPKIIVLRRK